MSLIENLERDGWKLLLQNSFEQALNLLAEDRFKWAGSSIDDLKSWLTAGGVNRVRQHLNDQMRARRFSSERMMAVNEELKRLVQENRRQLLKLTANGIVPVNAKEWLEICGLSETQFDDLLNRLIAGENPFEEWMKAQGRTNREIEAVYRLIDEWLLSSDSATLYTPSDLN